METPIVVGDTVRSFDFASGSYGRDLTGQHACFIEGEVAAIGPIEGCPRYLIKVTRQAFGGAEYSKFTEEWATPPVNGTPKMCGVCNYVERL